MNPLFILIPFLIGCTATTIRVKCENGSSCTVDSSTSANPQIDPTVDIPIPKIP